jgi:hypothetical protein
MTVAQGNTVESLRQYCEALEQGRRTPAGPRGLKEWRTEWRPRGAVWVRAVTGYPTHTFDDLVFEWTVGPRGGVKVGRANHHHGDTDRPQGKAKNLRAFYALAAEQAY